MSLIGTACSPSPISPETGRGARAMGGWAFGKTLRRRVRLSVFFAPSVAKCLSFPFGFPSKKNSKHKSLYILLYKDIAYLCLNGVLNIASKQLSGSELHADATFNLTSFGIRKRSFGMFRQGELKEFQNDRGVLQLKFESLSGPDDLGRGARATGGWVSDRTLRRRVRLSVFFAPFVAKCLSPFRRSGRSRFIEKIFSNKHPYILLSKDITCLCLNRIFPRIGKILSNSPLIFEDSLHLRSYAME